MCRFGAVAMVSVATTSLVASLATNVLLDTLGALLQAHDARFVTRNISNDVALTGVPIVRWLIHVTSDVIADHREVVVDRLYLFNYPTLWKYTVLLRYRLFCMDFDILFYWPVFLSPI
jgi:hypothetical protein